MDSREDNRDDPGGTITVLRPERVADAPLRGYLYQMARAALRWLQLEDQREVLLVEGNEDLDRIVFSTDGSERYRISESIKNLRKPVGIRDLRSTLRNFAHAFVTHSKLGQEPKFLFSTTAAARTQRVTADLSLDVLAQWENLPHRKELINALRALLFDARIESEETMAARAAINWLDEHHAWERFVGSITWNFNEPDLEATLGSIRELLSDRWPYLPANLLSQLLVHKVFRTAASPEIKLRILTVEHRERLLKATQDDLNAWVSTSEAACLRIHLNEMLHDGTNPLPQRFSPGRLLAASHEVVDFDARGRAVLLERLDRWCRAEERISVWLWWGAGGTGKTRLFIEWCKRLRQNTDEPEWFAGFLSRTPGDLTWIVRGTIPRFVVIDYADGRNADVSRLLTLLAAATEGPKVRVVLLARTDGEWWDEFSVRDERVSSLINRGPLPVQMPPLALDVTSRNEHFAVAVTSFRKALGRSDAFEHSIPDLQQPQFGQVLFIHIAALIVAAEITSTESDILNTLVQHELRYYDQAVENLNTDKLKEQDLKELIRNALACLTLVGGISARRTAEEMIQRIQATTPELARAAVRILRQFTGGAQNGGNEAYLGPVEPDLIGEAIIGSFLQRCARDDRDILQRVLSDRDHSRTRSAFVLLGRVGVTSDTQTWIANLLQEDLAQRAAPALEAAVQVGARSPKNPIAGQLLIALNAAGTKEDAERILSALPPESVSLADVAIWALKSLLKPVAKPWSTSVRDFLLFWRNPSRESEAAKLTLCFRLVDWLLFTGARKEALATTTTTLTRLKSLIGARKPGPAMAALLLRHGRALSGLDDIAAVDALESASQVAASSFFDRVTTLSAANWDSAIALRLEVEIELSHVLSRMGKSADAFGKAWNALIWIDGLQRPNSGKEPAKSETAYRQHLRARLYLAIALSEPARAWSSGANLDDTDMLTKLFAWARKLSAEELSAEIARQRRHAVGNRDAALPNEAYSLLLLALVRAIEGQWDDLLPALRDGVASYFALMEIRQNPFAQQLKMHINNLGRCLFSKPTLRRAALPAVRAALDVAQPYQQRGEPFTDAINELINLAILCDSKVETADGQIIVTPSAALVLELAQRFPFSCSFFDPSRSIANSTLE